MSKLTQPNLFFMAVAGNNLLGPKLTQSEVDGLNIIIDAASAANWPIAYTAYALATAYHETAHTMQPIHEIGGTAYFTRMYDIKGNRPALAKANGNTTPGDGAKYYGRGYVQLTWKNNYAKAEKKCNIPGLVTNPDLAMVPANAAKILVSGMSEGWFSSKKLSDYLPATTAANIKQFTDARIIINGHDDDALIAGYAVFFQDALKKGFYL